MTSLVDLFKERFPEDYPEKLDEKQIEAAWQWIYDYYGIKRRVIRKPVPWPIPVLQLAK